MKTILSSKTVTAPDKGKMQPTLTQRTLALPSFSDNGRQEQSSDSQRPEG